MGHIWNVPASVNFWFFSSLKKHHLVKRCKARRTLRVLTPRGHNNWHLPQSIHFPVSAWTFSVCPRITINCNWRRLNDVNRPAEQAAIQVPHPIHEANDGSCRNTCTAMFLDATSKSNLLLRLMLYPKLILHSSFFCFLSSLWFPLSSFFPRYRFSNTRRQQ